MIKYNFNLLEKYCETFCIKLKKEFQYIPKRKFRADLAIPTWKLLIEIVGGIFNKKAHGSITGIKKDIERLNFATIYGWQMLRITPEDFLKTQAIDLIESWRKQRNQNENNIEKK